MKSSIVLATSYAILAMAGPLAINKRAAETTVTNWVDVTVTVTDDGPKPTKMWAPGAPKSHHHHTSSSSTSTTPPPPPPTTTSTPPPPPPPASTPAETPVAVSVAVQVPAQSPAAQPAAAPASTGDDYQSQAIYHHNVHRYNHSAGSVSWSGQDAGYAQNTAQSCKFAHDMGQGVGGYGQNLAMWASSDAAQSLGAAKAVANAISDMWYTEMPSFPASGYGQDTPDMSNFEAWGHYSQMVWKGSNQIGCYTQFCPAGTMVDGMDAWFTVCNYRPAGNVGGAYGSNVGPPENQSPVVS